MNVWLALSHDIHPHHSRAVAWAATVGTGSPIYFCLVTQLGFLRMLTTSSAMGAEVMTQAQAWRAFDVLLSNPNIEMIEEPAGLDAVFRRATHRNEVSPKQWADGYLAAFASASGLSLVTFDKALARSAKNSILL